MCVLSIPLIVATVLLITGVHSGSDVGPVITLLQVLSGSITVVATGGAGSMALRDFGSKGATTSQVHTAKAVDPTD